MRKEKGCQRAADGRLREVEDWVVGMGHKCQWYSRDIICLRDSPTAPKTIIARNSFSCAFIQFCIILMENKSIW